MSPTISMRHCPQCNREFTPARPHQRFCRPLCKSAWHNTERKESSAVEIAEYKAQILELEEEVERLKEQLRVSRNTCSTWQRGLAGTG